MPVRNWSPYLFAGSACLLLAPAAAADPIVGQVDNFEDGTTQGWRINLLGMGSPPANTLPANIPTGGPAGLNDNFLLLTSNGSQGAGGRLVALTLDPRWTGDYVAAGVNAITMDVNNLGATSLALRMLFESVGPMGPTDVAASAGAVIVPPGSGWTRVTFPIAPDDLTALMGSVGAALTRANVVRLFHGPAAAFPGPASAAQLGVDNITASSAQTAAAVPEPATLAVFAGLAGAGGLVARRRRTAVV
jgi:hypothetical protein